MRVEVSSPPPAVWGSIPGLGIGGYANAFLALRSNGLSAEAAQADLGCFTAKVNRHGFGAVLILAAAPVGGQWLQRSERLRLRRG